MRKNEFGYIHFDTILQSDTDTDTNIHIMCGYRYSHPYLRRPKLRARRPPGHGCLTGARGQACGRLALPGTAAPPILASARAPRGSRALPRTPPVTTAQGKSIAYIDSGLSISIVWQVFLSISILSLACSSTLFSGDTFEDQIASLTWSCTLPPGQSVEWDTTPANDDNAE